MGTMTFDIDGPTAGANGKDASSNGVTSESISSLTSVQKLDDISLLSDLELDSEQKFWDGLSVDQVKYVNARLMYPAYDDADLSSVTGMAKSVIRRMHNNSKLSTYIKQKYISRLERFNEQELDFQQRVASNLSVELMKRMEESSLNRLDMQSLLGSGYSHHEAKLIMSTRLEGLTMKDLLSARAMIPQTVSKLREETSNGETAEVIEQLSKQYKKYRSKVTVIDVARFDPKNSGGFNLNTPASKSINDTEDDPITVEFE